VGFGQSSTPSRVEAGDSGSQDDWIAVTRLRQADLRAAPTLRRQSDVPVIMITAYGDDDTKPKAIEGGAEGLLTKPIDFALLREHIDTRLGRAV
jgi:DNA-binding response OmpR family regulator